MALESLINAPGGKGTGGGIAYNNIDVNTHIDMYIFTSIFWKHKESKEKNRLSEIKKEKKKRNRRWNMGREEKKRGNKRGRNVGS